jgi:hypothetical protein
MESWNVGIVILRGSFHLLASLSKKVFPMSQLPGFPYTTIPAFPYSTILIVSGASLVYESTFSPQKVPDALQTIP